MLIHSFSSGFRYFARTSGFRLPGFLSSFSDIRKFRFILAFGLSLSSDFRTSMFSMFQHMRGLLCLLFGLLLRLGGVGGGGGRDDNVLCLSFSVSRSFSIV